MEFETQRDMAWLLGVSVVFFVSAWMFSGVQGLYPSPDETANAFFAQTFAEHGRLYVFEPLNTVLGDVLFPRSVVALDGRLLPGSFLGLPVLYGVAIRLFGSATLPFWTPFVATLAVFAWEGIIRALFDRRVARLSALILFVHPAWWYYTARGLMPNILFTSLLIFSVFFLVVRPFEKWREHAGRGSLSLDVCMGGLLIGLALFVRTSEAAWIGLVTLAVLAVFLKKLRWPSVFLFFCSALLAVSPLFFFNRSLYGSAFSTGYTIKDETERVVFVAPDDDGSPLDSVSRFLAPFGIHPHDAWTHVTRYGAGLFWWLTLLVLIGLPLSLPTRADKGQRRLLRLAFLLSAILATGWLFLVYGSWTIHDNPDPAAVTIGNSYIRYWLPVFVMSTPFAALTIVRLRQCFPSATAARVASAAVFFLVIGFGARATFVASADGLVPVRQRLAASAAIRDRVLSLTESDAVIVVDRADKLFFPERRVRYPLRADQDATYDLLPRIARRAPLYYYGITLPGADIEYLNTRKLKERGLSIELVETYALESFYRISQNP
jgi:hypothetical protein